MTINFNFALTRRLHSLLRDKQHTLAIAESCTGGALGYQLTSLPGSSAILDRGFIVYTNESKIELLDVKPDTIARYGAVSIECAKEMAHGALHHSQATLAISITGIAGPKGGTDDKPVGTVCFGLCNRNDYQNALHTQFYSGRKNIRKNAVCFALKWLIEELHFQKI